MGKHYYAKRFLLSILLSAVLVFIFNPISASANADIEPEKAPINEDFLYYLENLQDDDNLQNYSHIPSPVEIYDKDSGTRDFKDTNSFPRRFDLREEGKVSPVRDQENSGTCWTFATYAAIESRLLPHETWDFSEDHLARQHGLDWDFNGGGNYFLSTAYLARWSGPILESDDPFGDGVSSSDIKEQKHVQEVLFLPWDMDAIKEALMSYGAIHTSIYAADEYEEMDYYNPNTYAYYYDGDKYSNHDIAIVGWDDDFPADKFVNTPAGNGAFICKNSWGESFGDNGYYYVSYYDSVIGSDNVVYTSIEDTDNYDNLYQYDPLGLVGRIGYRDETAWFTNVFTKSQEAYEALSAVSFYTTDENSSYEIWVSTDFEKNEFSNKTKITTGIIERAGYHTIALDEPILLKNNKFAVIVKLTTPGSEFPIGVEDKEIGYSSNASANSGESYISYDGDYWTDVTSKPLWENTNVCLKAFTTNINNSNVNLDECYEWQSKSNVEVSKTWKISFNQALDKNTLNKNNLKVIKADDLTEVDIIIKYDNNKTVEIMPINDYNSDTEYYLYINKDIQSEDGKSIKQPIRMKFITQ